MIFFVSSCDQFFCYLNTNIDNRSNVLHPKNNKNANLRPDASLALYTPRDKEGAGSSFKTTQREYLMLKRKLASCTALHKPGAGSGEHGAGIDKQMPKTSELLNVEIKRMKVELEEYYNAQKQRIIPRRLTTKEREVEEKKERIGLERQFKYYLKKLLLSQCHFLL